jgi:hypothetical protein
MTLTASAIEHHMIELSRELVHEGQHLRLLLLGGAALAITASVCGGPVYMANDIDVMAEPSGAIKTTRLAQSGLLNDDAVEADTTSGLREVVGRALRMGWLKQWISLPNLEVEVLEGKTLWATLLMSEKTCDKFATLEWLATITFSSPTEGEEYVRELYCDIAGVPPAKLKLVIRTIPKYFR